MEKEENVLVVDTGKQIRALQNELKTFAVFQHESYLLQLIRESKRRR